MLSALPYCALYLKFSLRLLLLALLLFAGSQSIAQDINIVATPEQYPMLLWARQSSYGDEAYDYPAVAYIRLGGYTYQQIPGIECDYEGDLTVMYTDTVLVGPPLVPADDDYAYRFFWGDLPPDSVNASGRGWNPYPGVGSFVEGTALVGPGSGISITPICTFTYRIEIVEEGYVDPTKQERRDLDCPAAGAGFGNPCDAATGNKYQREVDLDAAAGIGLSVVRHYASASSRDVGFGPGWTTRYHKRLELGFDSIRAYTDSGSSEGFVEIDGVWTGPANGRLQLTEDATGYTLTYRSGDYDRFDTGGRLVSEHMRGELTTYSYDSSGRLDTVTAPYGHSLTFGYDTSGRIDTITDPAGQVVRYGYDVAGNLATVTYPDLATRTYHYEDSAYPNALTGITDERGVRYATFGYDAAGRANLTQHAVTDNGAPQERYSFTFDSAQQTTVVEPRGITKVLTFEENLGSKNLVASANLDDGRTEVQVFDSNNNRIESTDGEGRATTYVYNTGNQLEEVRHVHGSLEDDFTTFLYESTQRDLITRIRERNAAGGQFHDLEITYDQNRNIDTITEKGYDADGEPLTPRVADYDYDAQGRLTKIDGYRNDLSDVTLFSYYDCSTGYQCGQLQSVTNALGQVTSISAYDAYGRVQTAYDPNGTMTQYVYDPRGRVLSITRIPPAGASRTTAFTYTPNGLVETVTSPENRTLTYIYDDANDLRVIRDSLGNEIRRDYDLAGNLVNESVHDPAGLMRKQMQTGYDARNRLASLTELTRTTLIVYDASGNLASVTDANANATSSQINALNKITQTLDALNGSTAYDYDADWNLTRVTAPNGVSTAYAYDDFGNLLEETSPDRGTLQHTYDAAGNRIGTVDGNGTVVNFVHDALNRLISVQYPEDPVADVVYRYDESSEGQNGIGRLTGTSTSSSETSRFYDLFGNIVRQRYETGGVFLNTYFTYDRDDRLVSVGYPSGRIVEYERDQTGRIIRVQSRTDATAAPMSLASEIAYEPFGPLAGLTYGNGHTTSIGYDQAYRIETIDTLAGSAVVQDWSFGRDPVGNITNWSDDAVGSRSQSLSYDALYRLDTARSQYGVMDFDYDANGNRKNKLEGAAATTYSYTPATNRLVGIDDATMRWTLAYDDAGNLISKLDAAGEGWLYGYSAGNRLASVSARELKFPDNGRKPPTEQDTVLATYTYDAFGQRIAATRNARTTLYIYGLNGALLTEVDSDLSRFRDYVYLEARAIAVQDLEAVTTSPPPTPVEVIVDNGDPGTLTTGAWSTLKNPKDFGTSYLLANGASGSTHFWFPSLAAGEYEVSAWWVSKNQYAPNVPYLINHDGQQTIVTVDQSGAGGQWNPLGTFTFDGSGSENVVVSDSAGKTTADAVRFVEVVSPTIETIETTHFVHADHLATPRAVTNQAGELVWSWFSTPFGNSLPDEDVDGDGTNFELNLRFPGQQYDAESGLHYNHFRDYDPATGRYIESDPVGLHGGLNAFAYAEGNPLYWSDRFGLVTLAEAYRSLRATGVPGRSGGRNRSYTDEQVFDEWLRLERKDRSWLDELPDCPETLPCADDTWREASSSESIQVFHPGARFEVRSHRTNGGHSSQCMYDELRDLITQDRPAAGTADYAACPSILQCLDHALHDIRPYNLAERLGRIDDYYDVRPTM